MTLAILQALTAHDLKRLAALATAIALMWLLAFFLSGKGGRWFH